MSSQSKSTRKTVIRAAGAGSAFTQTLNDFIWGNLSLAAVGAGVRMLSHHPDHAIDIAKFIDRCKRKGGDGKHAVRAALNELREAGYAQLVTDCTPKGRVVSHTWRFSDDPEILRKDLEQLLKQSPHARLADAPAKASRSQKSESGPQPDSDYPDPDFPDLDNRDLSNNMSKKDLYEKKEPISLSPDASASATARETDAALAGIEELLEAAKWHSSSYKPANRKTASALLADHSPQTREHLIKAAGLQDRAFERHNRANSRDESHRGFNISLHEWLKGPYIPFLADARKLLELEAAAKAAEAERLQRLEEQRAAERMEVEEACRYHADSIIRQLCEYLNPRHAQRVTTEGFRRGEWWGFKGPTPDHPDCFYPPEIIREAQRRNNETVISENGQSATVENLVNIRAGLRNWDAVRFGPPIGDPGCLLDPAIIEDVISRARKAA